MKNGVDVERTPSSHDTAMDSVGRRVGPRVGRRVGPRVAPWLPNLLRFAGSVCSLAWLAVAMPVDWMNWWHDSLGLGEMPRAAIVEYLARSTAALCGLYGIVLLWISCDVPRYVGLLRLITYSVFALACASCIVMWDSGLPAWWLAGDAVANLIVTVGVVYGTRNG
jgi:hypothetical protein